MQEPVQVLVTLVLGQVRIIESLAAAQPAGVVENDVLGLLLRAELDELEGCVDFGDAVGNVHRMAAHVLEGDVAAVFRNGHPTDAELLVGCGVEQLAGGVVAGDDHGLNAAGEGGGGALCPAAEAGAERLHLLHTDMVGEALDRLQRADEEFVVVVERVGLVVPHVKAVCEGPELRDVGGRAVAGGGVARVEAHDLDVAGVVELGQLDVPLEHLVPGAGQIHGVKAGLIDDRLVVHQAVAGASLEAGHAVGGALPLHRFEQAGHKVVTADDGAVVDLVVDGHDRAA